MSTQRAVEASLFSNAEGTENQVQDVIGGGCSRDRVEGPKPVVKIEQQHFVRDFTGHRGGGGIERGQ